MKPEEISAEVVAAAQQADAEWNRTRLARGDLGRNWQSVGDAQVRRLIAGAVTAERENIAELATTEAAKMRASNWAEHEVICAAALEDFAAELRGEQP